MSKAELEIAETVVNALGPMLTEIANGLGAVQQELVSVNKRLGAVENRLDAVEQELVSVNKRLDALEQEMRGVNQNLAANNLILADHDG